MKPTLFIVGARPNFIKIAPICMALKENSKFPFKILHTGQHYDQIMSDIFFQELNIPSPDYNLHIGSGSHGSQTGKMMIKLEELCLEEDFSAMVVIGDVNSTLAGALVASKLHIPVVHIESGLRSFNRSMPEEINRIVTDHVSDLLFAPTRIGMENLEKEGLSKRSVFSGDVMYDMTLKGQELAKEKSNILDELNLEPGQYFLATLHRPYNVDDPIILQEIMNGFSQLEKPVLLSAHPRLRKNLERNNISPGANIRITQPFGYLDFLNLEQHAQKIITDSGGIQKEAFFVQTPCITLRPETEWIETVETGANILVTDRSTKSILEAVEKNIQPNYQSRPYGNGDASEIIVNAMHSQFFTNQEELITA